MDELDEWDRFYQATKPYVPLSGLDFHILAALTQHSRYGYALMYRVALDSHFIVDPSKSTFYSAINRLERNKLIMRAPDRLKFFYPGKDHHYYQLTQLGKMVIARHVAWLNTVSEVRNQYPLIAHNKKSP